MLALVLVLVLVLVLILLALVLVLVSVFALALVLVFVLVLVLVWCQLFIMLNRTVVPQRKHRGEYVFVGAGAPMTLKLMRVINYHFNNPRFRDSQTNTFRLAAWSAFHLKHAVVCFVSSEIMKCRLLNLLLHHPTNNGGELDRLTISI